MSPRIVVFGATGYTGGLVAEALVRRGLRPVLAARSRHKLASAAERLGGPDTRAADVTDPASIHALVERGDLLLSTVGPFDRWGRPALDAAIDNGAHYLDSTGEPGFLRHVFSVTTKPGSRRSGCCRRSAMTTCPATSPVRSRSNAPASERPGSTSPTWRSDRSSAG